MKTINRSVTDVIDTEYREYAMYTLENRAIPSAIDGMKPVGRKLLYAMLTEHLGKKVKLADLAGISKYNYHHSESSAAGAAVTLTADWNNNCPVFTGHGNFGSRLVQEASAPRYIFASLSPNFKKIFIDSEVCPPALDPENPEPRFYLPIIPWVLVNGISGIAVGFATNILPRSVSDIISATRSCVKNEKKFLVDNQPIKPTFPHFNGVVAQEDADGLHWSTTGIIEYIGKYSYKISELPVGYDRETYIILLNAMIDKDLIRDFSDECSEDGFGFVIKASGAQKEQIDKDPIKYFKLQKQHSENLTTLGTDGKLKIFQSVSELIAYFCSYRTTKFGDKLSYDIDSLNHELNVLRDKIKFIHCVIDDKINFKTTTKAALLEYITTNITNQDYGRRFVNIPLYECTLDAVSELNVRENEIGKELGVLHSYTPEKMFLEKLTNLKL